MSRGCFAGVLVLVPGVVVAMSNPSGPAVRPVSPVPRGPMLEVSGNTARLVLPAIPSFAVPIATGGLHDPFELLVAGGRLHGARVRVGGYVTWIYDCATARARPDPPRAQIRRRSDDDPSACEQPKFYLGDAPTTPPDRSLWVVDVPRPPSKLGGERLSPDELARRPAAPTLTIGDYVEVTGTFAIRSPHGESNPEGVIVYEAIDAAKTAPPPATPTALPEAKLPPAPELPRPARPAVPLSAGDSIRHAHAGDRAYASRRYDTAIAEYEAAVRAWAGNDSAWDGLAGARSWRGDYRGAAEAAARAVALEPGQAMYWLLRGHLLYEAAIAEAGDRTARAQNGRADQVTVDRSTLDVTPALEALLVATSLEDQLWRAHYDIGRILRDRGDAKAAAEQLSVAIAQHAWEPGPYLALCELYRRWRYRDHALAIAELGTAAVPSSAGIWFELGLARDAEGDSGGAIDAYTRALEIEPGFPRARFQRGQAYFRNQDFAHARRDLQAVVKAGGSSFALQQARHMLATIAR